MRRKTKPTTRRVPQRKRDPLPAIFPQPGEPWMVAAMRAGLSAEQIKELRLEYEATRAYEARLAFDRAWAQAQQELTVVLRSKEVDFPGKSGGKINYWYAPYDQVVVAIKPVLGRHGLGYLQSVSNSDGTVTVSTALMGFGHRETPSTLTLPKDETGSKNYIQALGSAQTYAQRYTLLAACGMATADDDDSQGVQIDPAISPEQAEALAIALAAIAPHDATYLRRLLDWCQSQTKGVKVETVSDIRAAHFEDVQAQILRKKARLAQAA